MPEPQSDLDLQTSKFVGAMQGVWKKMAKIPVVKRPQQQPQESQGHPLDLNHLGIDQASGLKTSTYFYHTRFGEQARYCEEVCSWPEN
jgi:hypothetical protein